MHAAHCNFLFLAAAHTPSHLHHSSESLTLSPARARSLSLARARAATHAIFCATKQQVAMLQKLLTEATNAKTQAMSAAAAASRGTVLGWACSVAWNSQLGVG